MASSHALTLNAVRTGGKIAVAKALSLIDQEGEAKNAIALADEAFAQSSGHVIGITGPPGVGKSTLINALIAESRTEQLSVAIVAVDPSSQFSKGALLGDRTRFDVNPEDEKIFVRSLASRGALGGLSDVAYPTLVILRALFDRVLVESVGVGQSEAAIADVVDTVVLCVQPGSGDSLQFMKAGIMEIPDICVVTKTDFGAVAAQTISELEGALTLTDSTDQSVPVIGVSAQNKTGLKELTTAIVARSTIDKVARNAQAHRWIEQSIQNEFGWRGLQNLKQDLRQLSGPGAQTPFAHRRQLAFSLMKST